MNTRIEVLGDESEEAYASLLASAPQALLYHSLRYRSFLQRILEDAQSHYLLAYDDGELVAALPAFIKQGPMGPVVNSLPFFGSHGSIVSLPGVALDVKKALLQAFDEFCNDKGAICSTIIENPLMASAELFGDYKADFIDERIGQFTPLPDSVNDEEIKEQLMNCFHTKTRNLVRKGGKSGFEIGHDGAKETIRRLFELHESNMNAIGGLAKSWAVFQAIRRNFRYDIDYRIYTAKKDGQLSAGVLVFFFNQTAEYYTPVVNQNYRSDQPLSYLILEAMKDAVLKGCKRWNWGGTWLSQDGVYHFKSRWGTKETKYRYFVKVYSDIGNIRRIGKAKILEAYPYFFVLPFSEML